MYARLTTLVLILASLAFGGCVSIKETRTENKDGTTTIEKSVNGWAPSAYVVPRVYTPVPIYGRDHFYSGPLGYDPTPPVPYVTYGRMITDTIREAFVDGSRRICDVRPSAPHHCARIEQAHGWPRR